MEVSLKPSEETRAGRMLAAGQLTATVTSEKTGEHITLKFSARLKYNGKWEQADFEHASHVFVKVPTPGDWRGKRVGTFYPRSGKWFSADGAGAPEVFAAQQVGLYSAGVATHPLVKVAEQELCGKCGKELTDPESIERGIGPTCFGKRTSSRHARVA